MITSSYLLPNSPLLLDSEDRGHYFETRKAFKKVADELIKDSIDGVILLTSNAMEHEHLYMHIHNQFELQFSDFGDLVTKSTALPWWDGYHAIRDFPFSSNIEPLETVELDYKHAITWHLLMKANPELKKLPILPITLPEGSTINIEQLSNGLFELFNQSTLSVSIIACGNLAQTKNVYLAKELEQENSSYRDLILSSQKLPEMSIESPDLFPPTISAPYSFLLPSLKDNKAQEYAYEKSDHTSFLITRHS